MKQVVKDSLKRYSRLNTLKSLRRAGANILRQYWKGEVNSEYVRTSFYGLRCQAQILELESIGNIEQRQIDIENRLEGLIGEQQIR